MEAELREKISVLTPKPNYSIIEITRGGILLNCEIGLGLHLNRILRTPSKILLRIKTQKCRDLPKLFNIVRKIAWKDYLNQPHAEVKVSAKKSRLIHTGKIERSFHEGIESYFNGNKIKTEILEKHKDDPKQTVFIRLFEDELTISLDTSGDLLHIRGNRSFRGHASLRENIAALLITKLLCDVPEGKYRVIDPMCGTGTFLFEWRDRYELVDRNFAFQYSPLIKYTHNLEIDYQTFNPAYLEGFDIDEEIIDKLKDSEKISFSKQDVFKESPYPSEIPCVIVTNPPFGKRVRIQGDKLEYFEKIHKSVKKNYNPSLIGMIIPRDFVGELPGERLFFNLNGIEVCFLVQKL